MKLKFVLYDDYRAFELSLRRTTVATAIISINEIIKTKSAYDNIYSEHFPKRTTKYKIRACQESNLESSDP